MLKLYDSITGSSILVSFEFAPVDQHISGTKAVSSKSHSVSLLTHYQHSQQTALQVLKTFPQSRNCTSLANFSKLIFSILLSTVIFGLNLINGYFSTNDVQ